MDYTPGARRQNRNSTVTLLVLSLGVMLIQIRVRLEEEFLAAAHGEDYAGYRRRVRRWL